MIVAYTNKKSTNLMEIAVSLLFPSIMLLLNAMPFDLLAISTSCYSTLASKRRLNRYLNSIMALLGLMFHRLLTVVQFATGKLLLKDL
jgi:hypothetical protein